MQIPHFPALIFEDIENKPTSSLGTRVLTMNWVAGSSKNSWQPVMTADTTNSHYWLNWRAGICATWILSSVIAASVLIWKYEGSNAARHGRGETQQERVGFLCDEESWRPCLKEIHPGWLLAFRIVAFFVLLPLLIANTFVDGGGIFYFYTQWTFTLVIIYFGLGTSLSIYGCYQYLNKVAGDGVEHMRPDAERGMYVGPAHGVDANRHRMMKNSATREEHCICQIAGIWGYAFQIIYQLLIVMHSMNAFFLFGDAALNCLRFPWFRISYFVLWTSLYVIFQWIIHACVSLWWPYPFLDLSLPYAPIWYLVVALLHLPCYAIFALLIKMKHHFLSRRFPQSFQCLR
ncbi:uncharacterized protein LOC131235060 isoform X2 [Magnolia sinica]|uniref:uncharacterized protein LOC131235060 isoform X2 n=1 Tax=Magnolia sinica TaxID=86752 RepID=UPI00265825A0|nr:uncharacterized protein LOC131235060 isoform X2 [Magnolia sinica]